MIFSMGSAIPSDSLVSITLLIFVHCFCILCGINHITTHFLDGLDFVEESRVPFFLRIESLLSSDRFVPERGKTYKELNKFLVLTETSYP